MTCVHKDNKPAYFVCYVRHADPTAILHVSPSHGSVPEAHQLLHARLVQDDSPFKNFVMPLEQGDDVIDDPEMDEVFEALSSAQVELPW